ncbi:MAG: SagB/ThcOx family dehydrogenase [Anaerolineae bacterium]|nr:SagB/ThcOx family dehydrogenase [Anaerolineae bacterium]
MDSMDASHKFLKSGRGPEWEAIQRDQDKGVPTPPFQQSYPADVPLIDLVAPEDLNVGDVSLVDALSRRRSHRKFTREPLTLEELSFLLWVTQGVKRVRSDGMATLRTVPSAGSRHPLETYLLVHHVQSLAPGLYRYLALEHKLCFLHPHAEPAPDKWFLRNSAVVFVWSAVPYRTEWRHSTFSHKMIAMDAGHVCQNLYLACEAIGAGTCAVGVYWQDEMDALLGLDGVDEFTLYVAPVGKIQRTKSEASQH